MTYFVIYESEDGDTSISLLTEEELQRKLRDCWWGDEPKWVTAEEIAAHKNDNLLPGSGTYLIVKGAVVVPKPKVEL